MNDSTYHAARARAEIEAAYRSQSSKAATVHLQLCALHLDRAKTAPSRSTLGASWEITWLERAAAFHRCTADREAGDPLLPNGRNLFAAIPAERTEERMLGQL